MKNIIFIAPPAAGKGTISDYLVKTYHYVHISTGDLLRDEIASGSAFGQKLDTILKSGSLVDDETVNKLVYHKLESIQGIPFILDGYPRTLMQAQYLEQVFQELHIKDFMVVYLEVDLDTVLKRVLGRVICPNCKRSYNLNNEKLKPLHQGVCDDCGAALIKRDDDNEDVFRSRYTSFMEYTKPILDYYDNQGVMVKIDATLELETIYQRLENEAKND